MALNLWVCLSNEPRIGSVHVGYEFVITAVLNSPPAFPLCYLGSISLLTKGPLELCVTDPYQFWLTWCPGLPCAPQVRPCSKSLLSETMLGKLHHKERTKMNTATYPVLSEVREVSPPRRVGAWCCWQWACTKAASQASSRHTAILLAAGQTFLSGCPPHFSDPELYHPFKRERTEKSNWWCSSVSF